MTVLKKILAPTDFSVLSAEGMRYACQLAKENAAELVVLNVAVVDETNAVDKREVDEHRARLDQFANEVLGQSAKGLRMRKVVAGGQPFSAIIDCADSERADLIVISSHGRTGLSRMLIGSVTDKLLRGARCPVLVVPVGK